MVRRSSLLLLLAVGVATPARAGTPCPESCTTNGIETFCSTAPVRDSSSSVACDPYPGPYEDRAFYDLTLGQVYARARSCQAFNSAFAQVTARDRFRLVGPSGGGPVAFTAKLAAYGAAGGYGTVSAAIAETGGDSRGVDDAGMGGFSQDLLLPLAHAVGEEFELVYEATASADNTALAQGVLSFTGLPPGYGVASCQGFAGDGAVPALPTSWGTLKIRYR